MRLSDLLDRPVVSRADATEVGRVEQVVVDAADHRITALVLRAGDVVPVGLATIGPDAVVIDDASVLEDRTAVHEGAAGPDGGSTSDRPRRAGRPTLLGARALAETGDDLGIVTDLDLDETDGTIRTVVLDGGDVDGGSLLGVGDYAVVLADRSSRRSSPNATNG